VVNGDVLLSGGEVTLLASVGDDARIIGGSIITESNIGRDLAAIGGQIHITGRVGGDAGLVGGVIRLEAPVSGNLRVLGGEIVIDAPVGGNVRVDGGKVTLGENAVIAGDLMYRTEEALVAIEGSTVRGTVTALPFPRVEAGIKESLVGMAVALPVLRFLSIFLGALLLGLLFRRYAEKLVATATEKPLLEFGRGLITMIVLPIASVLLLITLVGAPLGILGLIAFAGIIVYTCFVASILLGSVLVKLVGNRSSYEVSWVTILVGSLAYSLLCFIPVVGIIVQAILFLTALGATLKIKWDLAKEWR
jgi:hypothetical protein